MFLGIDCGTQSTKALLIDAQGDVQGTGQAPHALIERSSGAREQEPKWWVDALRIAVTQAIAQTGNADVQSMGVSGQQHGLVVLDAEMQVIRPAKLWNDTETADQNARLVKQFGGAAGCSERFGIVPLTGYTISKLLWLKEREPENFSRVRHILLPHEYLNFWLTGKIAAEYGDASGTAFFDVRSRQWIREVLDWIDGGTDQLFAALPPLIQADESVGTVRPEVAAELGIAATCLVSAGGGDNMMGAIGTGNVREGVVTMSLGTSSTVYTYREHAVLDPSGQIAPFCSSSGGWLPLVCTMNATNVVNRTLELFGKGVAEIDRALATVAPGGDGLTFLPFLNGERTPDLPQARGSLLGIAMNNLTAEHMLRATIEGVTFGVLAGLDLILAGEPVEKIVLIGGGARSAGWRQLLADATGCQIETPTQDEAGALGAAMQSIFAYQASVGEPETMAAIADRCVHLDPLRTAKPDPAKFAEYGAAFALYRTRLSQLYPTA